MELANLGVLVDLAALAGWMDRLGLGKGPIEDAVPLSGGTQNFLLRFSRSGLTYVLRRPPPHLRSNSNRTMLREARVLEALSGSAVPHPAMIAACADESVIGAAFYLMEPVDGFNATQSLQPLHADDPVVRRRMGFAMVDAIAALGAIDHIAVGLADFGKLEDWTGRQVARWTAQLESYRQYDAWPGAAALPGIDTLAHWLQENLPPGTQGGIIHGDFHLANVMFRYDSGELAAVIDWELCTLGDPLLDLGWLAATWPEDSGPVETDVAITPWRDFASISEMVAHYGAQTGRDLTHFDWYAVLACFKLGIILEGTHARACAGQAPHQTGQKLHAHARDLFARALRRIG